LAAIETSNDTSTAATDICQTCGRVGAEKFCSHCGELILRRPDYSLRGLLGETVNVVTNVESNIFRSFWSLLRRPGLLTVEYFAGRRKQYLKPLQLFIFCNIIFFSAQAFPGHNLLRTPLRVHLFQMPYSQLASQKVGEELKRRNIEYNEYRASFDSIIETQAKTLVFLMIPMYALGLTVLYLGSREYIVKHIVFATHFFSFFLLWHSVLYVVAVIVILIASRMLGRPTNIGDFGMTSISLSVCLVYLFLSSRRAYQQSWTATVLRSIALVGILMITVQLYRFVLFFTTFYTV
jgi:hypothetical protein